MKTGELYDLLQTLFGIGDFDDGAGLWYQSRGIEVGKLTAMLKARHCTAEEVAEAAHYAAAQRIPVTQSWQVFNLVPEAKHAHRLALSTTATEALQQDRAASIRQALDLHDSAWAERLMRTPDAHLEQVLEEWKNHVDTLP